MDNRGLSATAVDWRGWVARKLKIPKLSFALAALLAAWAGSPAAGVEPEAGYQFTAFAGRPGSASMDGEGAAARFGGPWSVAVDGAGNVYVADVVMHTIRKITPGGVVATWAGSAREPGRADGTGSAARFNTPSGVAVDGAGNVYVADRGNHTIRKITPGGVVTTFAGSAGESGEDDGRSEARFSNPSGVAVDSAGNVYVADRENHTIRKITPGGAVVTWAGLAVNSGQADGTGSEARFFEPTGVAVDGAGNVYVADSGNQTIRKITPGRLVTTLAGLAWEFGSADGAGSAARFLAPTGVAVDGVGNLYVADSGNQTIRKITPGGEVSTWAGSAEIPGSADGAGSAARFRSPAGVAVDSVGNVFVADAWNQTIRKITLGGVVTTLAGLALGFDSADGAGSAARFNSPSGVAVDSAGNVYVADSGNQTIRKITPGGEVSTWAGLALELGSADGAGSVARFDTPSGVAVDSVGNVYVADTNNHTIRKITPGGEVSTWAGSAGEFGSGVDGAGSAARFTTPSGVAVDGGGNVYVAEPWRYIIRKITPGGVVATWAGSANLAGRKDGMGSAARFLVPTGVAVDSGGNVYVADTGNQTIRKITPEGAVTTFAGSAWEPGFADGAGSAARFNRPEGVAVDGAGNVYVADTDNHAIRKITPGGVVTTLVRWVGNVGAAQAGSPNGVAVDGAGNIYVSETLNDSILVGRRTTVVDPAPSLAARWQGGQIILSWPQMAVGYGLEQSGQLGAGAAWSPITTGIGTEGANFTHTHSPTEGSHFFRLRKP